MMKEAKARSFVSLEDHFVSKVCQQDDVAQKLALHQFPKHILDQLTDVGQQRIQVMDESQIRLQVVSHIPFVIDLEGVQATNDQLHDAVKQNKSRIAAFATLPMSDPASIPGELERCVRELGFVGALIPNHANGVYYDGAEFLPMWEMAEKLNVPIYLHPCPPSSQSLPLFHGNYSDDIVFALSTHAWDWHANCGLHFIRLYAAGLFERYPKLKIVLGHLGEMLPFMLGRIQRKLDITPDAKSWTSTVQEVYGHNVWITTSGMFDVEPFKLVLNTTNIDRIMFSVDYPFESTSQSVGFMQEIRRLGLVTEEELEKIAGTNAEALLNVQLR